MSNLFELSHIQFLFDAFQSAISGIEWFVLAYALCIAAFFIIGNRFFNAAFVYPFALMAVTVFNPFLIVPLSEVIGLTTRIRRLFWLLPVNLVLAYVFTWVCTVPPRKSFLTDPPSPTRRQKNIGKCRRAAAVVCIVLFVVCLGEPMGPYMHLPQNIYKTDNTILALANLLEEDSSETGLRKKVLYSNLELLELREYDPSIESVLRRNELLSFQPDISDPEAVQEIIDSKHILRTMALVSRFHVRVKTGIFRKRAAKCGANYIISESDSQMGDYYEEAGYVKIATVGVFDVFRTSRTE